jgi:hypothetical protein
MIDFIWLLFIIYFLWNYIEEKIDEISERIN